MIYRDAGALLERIATLENRCAAARARAARLARRRRKQRLVRSAIGVAGLAIMIVCAAVVFVVFQPCLHCDPGKNDAKIDMRTIHPIAEKWLVDHGRCPTIQQLVREKEVSQASKLEDPWGHTYEIVCEGDEVYLASSGPDGEVGTADDLRVPEVTAR